MVFIGCHKAHFSRLLLVRVRLRPRLVKLQKLLDRQEYFSEGQHASLTAMNSISVPHLSKVPISLSGFSRCWPCVSHAEGEPSARFYGCTQRARRLHGERGTSGVSFSGDGPSMIAGATRSSF